MEMRPKRISPHCYRFSDESGVRLPAEFEAQRQRILEYHLKRIRAEEKALRSAGKDPHKILAYNVKKYIDKTETLQEAH